MKITEILTENQIDDLTEGPIGTAIGAGLGGALGGVGGAVGGAAVGNWAGNKIANSKIGRGVKGAWQAAKAGYRAGVAGANAPDDQSTSTNATQTGASVGGNTQQQPAGSAPIGNNTQQQPAGTPPNAGQETQQSNATLNQIKTSVASLRSNQLKQLKTTVDALIAAKARTPKANPNTTAPAANPTTTPPAPNTQTTNTLANPPGAPAANAAPVTPNTVVTAPNGQQYKWLGAQWQNLQTGRMASNIEGKGLTQLAQQNTPTSEGYSRFLGRML